MPLPEKEAAQPLPSPSRATAAATSNARGRGPAAALQLHRPGSAPAARWRRPEPAPRPCAALGGRASPSPGRRRPARASDLRPPPPWPGPTQGTGERAGAPRQAPRRALAAAPPRAACSPQASAGRAVRPPVRKVSFCWAFSPGPGSKAGRPGGAAWQPPRRPRGPGGPAARQPVEASTLDFTVMEAAWTTSWHRSRAWRSPCTPALVAATQRRPAPAPPAQQ